MKSPPPITHADLLWMVGREHLTACTEPLHRFPSYCEPRGSGRRRRLRVVSVYGCFHCACIVEVSGPEFVGQYKVSEAAWPRLPRPKGGP